MSEHSTISDISIAETRKNRWQQTSVLALLILSTAGVFLFDIYTPPDDVSICFIYALLVSLSGYAFQRAPYVFAAIGTLLSFAGAFIQPPYNELLIVFYANRAIAIVAQWLVAFLVVMRRNAELQTHTNYLAERANAETSRRFVDVLTHELGTSLTAIDGHAFRLKRTLANNAVEDAPQRIERIRLAARHIEGVLRQVQLAFEIRMGHIPVELLPVDLKAIIADAITAVKGSHEVNVDTAKLPPLVLGNPDRLQQVVENLLSNAVKYSPADSPISVWGRTEDGMAVVSVSDRGRGVPPDEIDKLFQPYFRASNSRGIHGTGIGLYVVQQYVQSNGGTIDLMSELGAWTTATFKLPIGKFGDNP